MIELCKTQCCTMMEINNLSEKQTPEAALEGIAYTLIRGYPGHYRGFCPYQFIIFTGVTTRRGGDHASDRFDNYGEAFATYLENNNFGKVTKSEERTNRITLNGVTVWLWHPNYEVLLPFLRELTAPKEPIL